MPDVWCTTNYFQACMDLLELCSDALLTISVLDVFGFCCSGLIWIQGCWYLTERREVRMIKAPNRWKTKGEITKIMEKWESITVPQWVWAICWQCVRKQTAGVKCIWLKEPTVHLSRAPGGPHPIEAWSIMHLELLHLMCSSKSTFCSAAPKLALADCAGIMARISFTE